LHVFGPNKCTTLYVLLNFAIQNCIYFELIIGPSVGLSIDFAMINMFLMYFLHLDEV
ncbi:hypothetical protein ACJX0J_008864, partial [Zea mays]